jgi:hypothetical protein
MVNATLSGSQIQSNKVNIRKRVILGPWNIALAQDSKVLHFTYRGIKQFQISKDKGITTSEPYIPTNDSMTFTDFNATNQNQNQNQNQNEGGGNEGGGSSTVYGCTDSTAMNYLPTATNESGSGSTCILIGAVGGTVLWNLMLITADFGSGANFPNNSITDTITIKDNVSDATSLLTSTPNNGSQGYINFNLKDNATYKLIMTNATTKDTYIYNFNKPVGVTTGQTLTTSSITFTSDASSPIDGTPSS